jgi:N-methylhydantoinase A/oxoprolinase/acetone carboxylase beta subunit
MSDDLVLGIDTGGTYTDGVLLSYDNREIVSTTKKLTTHRDLKICILDALDELLPEDPMQVKLVAISTTLATNAIAEGKGRPAALFLLGYDPDLVQRFNFESNFATGRFYYFEGGHDLLGQAQAPLDMESILQKTREIESEVEAIAISGYFSPFNPEHELKARQVISEVTDHPVVLGHQLTSKLNSVQRATTATLNASLLSILQEFVEAMRRALVERGLQAPLMIMRGDGALMSDMSLSRRPVETVHSGPAASAIGGRFLSGQDKALVIDIGGTTTDIAVLDRGRVNISEEGTTVGKYRTAVRAANVRSIGLGGDSMISFDVEGNLVIGPARVTPISRLSSEVESVARDLRSLDHRMYKRPSPDYVEYWFLQREPRNFLQNDRAREAVQLIHERPMALPDLLQRMGVFHPLQFNGQTLVQEEIVGRAGLTPTDLLHVSGEFDPWDREAAQIAANLVARLQGWSIEELIHETKEYIAERIVAEIVAFISGKTLERRPEYATGDDLGLWLFEESLYNRHPYLRSRITLKIPIIGIGAPAGIFLPRVAEMLGTQLILPPHFRVANAVGAVSGSVMASQEAWVMPRMRNLHVTGYDVQAAGERVRFARLDEAKDYAREKIGALAIEAARQSGAVEPHLEYEELPEGPESCRLRALAIGTPQLGS